MASVWCGNFVVDRTSSAFAATAAFFRVLGSDAASSATATGNVLVTWRGAGKIRDLQVFVPSNSRASATAFQLVVNGVAAGPIISVPALTTGLFRFAVGDELSIADGDTLCLRVLTGTGTGPTLAVRSISFSFEGAGGVTSGMHGFAVNGLVSSAASLAFGVDGGGIGASETQIALVVGAAGRFSNMRGQINTNTFSLSVALSSRKNLAAGAQSATIPTTSVVDVEDTTNSDTVTVGDKFALQAARAGSGSGSLNLYAMTTKFVSDGSSWDVGGSYGAGTTFISTAADSYYPIMGLRSLANAVEADSQLYAPFDMYISRLRAQWNGAASASACGLTLRVNGVDTALVANFPTATVGATAVSGGDAVFVPRGSLLSIKMTPPAVGSRNMRYIYVTIDTAPPAAVLTSPDVFTLPRRTRPPRDQARAPFLTQTIQLVVSQINYGPFGGFGLTGRATSRRERHNHLFSTTVFVAVSAAKRRPFVFVQT